ncbi:uncharacterized protein LOC121367306 [Gigantopelta aegis]|uniref:uncharacterized protein LOC121367306 n=1 Tax=Gigantopelta aegis TaxID=1735272 RepID=UPI001B887C07|nr:uncharacterized protein LOC121367306 [Gigantopelta aegis]
MFATPRLLAMLTPSLMTAVISGASGTHFNCIDDFDFERLFDELSEKEFTFPPLAPSSVTTTVVSSSPDATTSAMDSDDDDVFIYTPSTIVASGSPVATTSATVANPILRSILKTPYM